MGTMPHNISALFYGQQEKRHPWYKWPGDVGVDAQLRSDKTENNMIVFRFGLDSTVW